MKREISRVPEAVEITPHAQQFPAGQHGRPRDRLELLAKFLLLSLIVITPWLFGGVRPTVQVAAACVALAVMACWLVGMMLSGTPDVTIPVVAVVLLLAVLLGIAQLLPLGTSLLERVSPVAAELWRASDHSADPAVAGKVGPATISLYPASTRRDLSLLVLASLVFLLSARFFRTSRDQFLLWRIVAINGAALAVFGIIQQVTWNGKLYWTVKPVQVIRAFGPYVNHNNAAGYLNLCLAGVVAILLSGQQARSTRRRNVSPEASRVGNAPERRGHLLWRWTALILGGSIVAGILCSLSRGAFVALAGAAVTMLFAARYARGGLARMSWLAAAVVFGAVIVGCLGMTQSVQSRLATILHQAYHPDERLLHWKDSVTAIPDFFVAGSGFGTYRYVYRQYETRLNDAWFYHAENQYLEALMEGGVPGLVLMLSAVVLVSLACYHLLRHDPEPEYHALALAALFAVTTQAIHAFFDFGLYLTANMLLAAVICGAVVGRASRFGSSAWTYRFVAFPRIGSFAGAVLFLAALAAECAFPLSVARSQASLSSAREKFEQEFNDRDADVTRLETAAFEFTNALDRRWDDAELQEIAANAWIDLYRKRSYDGLLTDAANAADGHRLQLWQMTHPALLGREATALARAGNESRLESLRRRPIIQQTLYRGVTHLLLSRQACPLLPLVHLRLGELSFILEDPAGDNRFLEPLLSVGVGRPDVMYYAGLIDFDAGRTQRAFRFWRESLARSPRYVQEVLERARQRDCFDAAVEQTLPPSPERLVRLAREQFKSEELRNERRALLNRAEQLLQTAGRPESETSYLRAVIHSGRNEPLKAIDSYRQALRLAPERLNWRYELAMILEQQGLFDEALKEAKLCAQMDPGNSAYRQLFQQLNGARKRP